jgi:hypothetical protein
VLTGKSNFTADTFDNFGKVMRRRRRRRWIFVAPRAPVTSKVPHCAFGCHLRALE